MNLSNIDEREDETSVAIDADSIGNAFPYVVKFRLFITKYTKSLYIGAPSTPSAANIVLSGSRLFPGCSSNEVSNAAVPLVCSIIPFTFPNVESCRSIINSPLAQTFNSLALLPAEKAIAAD